ncbi:MAG: Mov34/MPN/PAD-1 family protein [Candidatus Omnitrophica bacterium]|nr:Mov34/MPN/PAD-1 family protein [Candidatus Omnitrophota bacterium]
MKKERCGECSFPRSRSGSGDRSFTKDENQSVIAQLDSSVLARFRIWVTNRYFTIWNHRKSSDHGRPFQTHSQVRTNDPPDLNTRSTDRQSNPESFGPTEEENPERKHLRTIKIFEEDSKLLCEEVLRHPHQETGGALLGHITRRGTIIVYLIIPQGPNASQSAYHFKQDIHHLLEVLEFMLDKYGLEYVGDWHTHHQLGLEQPSGEDANNMASISAKNAAAPLAQIIANIRSRSTLSHRFVTPRKPMSIRSNMSNLLSISHEHDPGLENLVVKLNPFVYSTEGSQKYERSRIQLLEGKSPILQALENVDPTNDLNLRFDEKKRGAEVTNTTDHDFSTENREVQKGRNPPQPLKPLGGSL